MYIYIYMYIYLIIYFSSTLKLSFDLKWDIVGQNNEKSRLV